MARSPAIDRRLQRLAAAFTPDWLAAQEEWLEAVFHRSDQRRALWVQPHLQSGNRCKSKPNLQPVHEAICTPLKATISNVRRDAASQPERTWEE
jgi:hypothetical protein